MSNTVSSFDENQPVSLEALTYRLNYLHKRVSNVEAELEKYDLAVIALKLDQAITGLDTVRRALYGLMFAIVAGSVTFAFTVFALLGKHP